MEAKIELQQSSIDDILIGTKKDGRTYSVRKDRHRYFFPDEWNLFYNSLNDKNKFLFDTLIATGARIEEALNLRPRDFNFDRRTITLMVTKAKATKGESKATGGARRSFSVSTKYLIKLRKYLRDNEIKDDELIFKSKKGDKHIAKQAVWKLMRERLQSIGMKDYYNFSLHNIRKTHGMWLKTLQHRGKDLDVSEICMRLGHDMNTFLKHYGSPSIFGDSDRDKMIEILGDIYELR